MRETSKTGPIHLPKDGRTVEVNVQNLVKTFGKHEAVKGVSFTIGKSEIFGLLIDTWPASAAKIQASMANLKVDLKGLRGGPIEWTKDNHFRTKQYYRVYRWDGSKVALVKDWFSYDVK